MDNIYCQHDGKDKGTLYAYALDIGDDGTKLILCQSCYERIRGNILFFILSKSIERAVKDQLKEVKIHA